MNLTARWWATWGVILGLPMAAFVTLLLVPQWDKSFGTFDFHFWVVSITALAAAFACAFIVGLTESLRESRLLFLGLAFLSIASIFAVHGLGTPGHIHDKAYAELGVSSWLSVLAGAAFVALSVIDLPESVDNWLKRYGTLVFGIVTMLAGLYIGLSFVAEGWLGFLPYEERWLQLLTSAAVFGLLGFGAWRYLQAFLFARQPSQWAMVCVLVLLIEVQVSLTFGRFWLYSWWMYHGMYALCFVVLFGAWAYEGLRAGNLKVIADGLSMRDAIAQLNHGYSQPIAELVDAIEWKDLYTLGHVRRVASFSVMIGKELGLSTLDLRALALGAQMHDVGKIGVPDRILTKPGPLTSEEFTIIKEHVARGYEIAQNTKALHVAIDAIHFHHEKWDGTGYPEGLTGDAIPLHARIVAVADAYDAMTSGRVYQPAVLHDAAFAELRRCTGTHFDSACIEAFASAMSKVRDARPATDVATQEPSAAKPNIAA
ncbi:MAG TPA: HD-GYP domain-containing protein [Dehalococcoidia bacterium]|nr:HD-GYP domain-containing protein [Dehalococcoidia bacterium]